MRAPLNDEELDARLALIGLVRDTAGGAPPPSKNRTVVCRQGRRRFLVKIADGPGNFGVLREGSVLERVSQLAKNSPLHLPTVHAFNPAQGLLSLEWIQGGETLHHYHRRTQDYAPELAAQVGEALGYLHRMSRESPSKYASADAFRDESDLLECFLRMRPDFYARLSQVGIDFFGSVQADGPAMQGLQALSDTQSRDVDAALLHGDLRQANLLRVPKGRGATVVYLDWELSFWGDAARDLGSLLCDYLLGWLAPEHRSEVLSRAKLADFSTELLRGYAASREPGFKLDTVFLQRVVRWVGAALLIAVYGISHYEQVLDARALGITRHALDMLGEPAEWANVIYKGKS